MGAPKYSLIVPVFNRPREIEELLASLTKQTYRDFEVVLVEDGSTVFSKEVFENYADKLAIRYFVKPNSGPGPSRNFGFEHAAGAYFVVVDSDCILPTHYFESLDAARIEHGLDAWGGPDRGSGSFTYLQRAMAYTMSSVLTTGGIRGKSANGFQPRSFNMGFSRMVFEETRGFRFDRLAEDIELSIRIRNAGFKVGLIPEAYVFHKRRATLAQFFTQVSGFGRGRVRVGRAHPGTVKLTHWFPALFFAGLFLIPVLGLIAWPLAFALTAAYFFYLLLIGASAWIETRSVAVGTLAVPSAFIQLTGYGSGFLKEIVHYKA